MQPTRIDPLLAPLAPGRPAATWLSIPGLAGSILVVILVVIVLLPTGGAAT